MILFTNQIFRRHLLIYFTSFISILPLLLLLSSSVIIQMQNANTIAKVYRSLAIVLAYDKYVVNKLVSPG